ncbi:mitochondrial carrier domain-containing protein, partial [Collybia nuda]
MTGLVVGFPFDTVKVRFQSPHIAQKYHSTIHAIATIVREERFLGLYKGISSPLATVALMNGLVFASYRFLMKLQLDHADAIPTLTQITLAGAGSGIVSSIITTPTELIKIRQQSLLTPTSARQVALQIFKEAGVRGLYRGITATALRDCGYGAYFAAYEATSRYLSAPSPLQSDNLTTHLEVETGTNKLSWASLLIAGGVAGIIGWLATFPLDVVKTRIQGSHKIIAPLASFDPSTSLLEVGASSTRDINPYRTTLSTIINSYHAEGFSVFFRGLSPTLIRAIPVNMMTFATFETIIHTF